MGLFFERRKGGKLNVYAGKGIRGGEPFARNKLLGKSGAGSYSHFIFRREGSDYVLDDLRAGGQQRWRTVRDATLKNSTPRVDLKSAKAAQALATRLKVATSDLMSDRDLTSQRGSVQRLQAHASDMVKAANQATDGGSAKVAKTLGVWRTSASAAESLAKAAAKANETAVRLSAKATEASAKAVAAQAELDAKLAAAAAEQASKAAAKTAEETAKQAARGAEAATRAAAKTAEAAARATAVAVEATAKATAAATEATVRAAAYTAAAAAAAVASALDG